MPCSFACREPGIVEDVLDFAIDHVDGDDVDAVFLRVFAAQREMIEERYRSFLEYTLLRKSTCTSYKRRMLHIRRKMENGGNMTYSEYCSCQSYKGWLKPCDHYRLYEKYGKPLEPYVAAYYINEIQNKKGCIT